MVAAQERVGYLRTNGVKTSENCWSHSNVRDYLVLIANNRNALLSYLAYPDEIELGQSLRTVLHLMRSVSRREGRETYVPIAVDLQCGVPFVSLLSSGDPFIGGVNSVSGWSLYRECQIAMKKLGADAIVGDLHTHNRKGTLGIYSPEDLYCMVGDDEIAVCGIVDGEEYLFAFRTKESGSMDHLSRLQESSSLVDTLKLCLTRINPKQRRFSRYWYEAFGFQHPHEQGKSARTPTEWDLWQINRAIAARHFLVLYKGKEGEALQRVI